MVNKNKIITLVLAAAVLAIVASGTASASVSFNGADYSKISSGSSTSWQSNGNPVSPVNNPSSNPVSVTAMDTLTWPNKYTNNDGYNNYYPTLYIEYTDYPGSSTQYNDNQLIWGGTWTPTGNAYTSARTGTWDLIVKHYYGKTDRAMTYSVRNDQYYTAN